MLTAVNENPRKFDDIPEETFKNIQETSKKFQKFPELSKNFPVLRIRDTFRKFKNKKSILEALITAAIQTTAATSTHYDKLSKQR